MNSLPNSLQTLCQTRCIWLWKSVFIFDYLKNRKQRTKVSDGFSKWPGTKLGVPQGSILGPLLFNLFTNDMFFFIEKTDIANYADDNTQYATDTHLDDLLKLLVNETSIVINWFKINENEGQ